MNSLEFWCDSIVAVISLQKDDFKETQCKKQDTDEFPNIPLSIKGPVITAFVYPLNTDMNNDEIRLSLRSKDGAPITAQSIAEYFGGAGHKDSAGETA
jgi:nanoRNase/pAp phosphatase (c-di-AMP/oligoRNAs hydrolase)